MIEALMPLADARVSLRAITVDTVNQVIHLSDTLSEAQQQLVPPNAVSIAQAHYLPKAWPRAIFADETPVGFLMLHEDPDVGDYFLWRLMIAGPHQRKGFGSRAVKLLVEHVRTRPKARCLCASFYANGTGLETFYKKLGFECTSKSDRETSIRLVL